MDTNFKQLMEIYKKDGNNLFKIKKRIFALFGDDHVLEYIDELINVSNEREYLEGEAIGYVVKAMYYLDYFGEVRNEYIIQAKDIFNRIPNYKELENYLTLVNYYLLLSLKENNTAKVFEYSRYGMRMAKNIENEEIRLSYNMSFVINYSHILHALKLYDEIILQLEETLIFRKYLNSHNLCASLHIKGYAYMGLNKYDEALECLFECIEILDKNKVYRYFNSAVAIVNIFLEKDDLENATKYYNMIIKEIEELGIIEAKIFSAISTKYYYKKGDIEKSLEYLNDYVNSEEKLFYEKFYLDWVIDIAKEISKDDLYIVLLERSLDLSREIDDILTKIYGIVKDEYVRLDENFNDYYRYLYNQFLLINAFHSELNKSRSINNIVQIINKNYVDIFEIYSAKIHIVKNKKDIELFEEIFADQDIVTLNKVDHKKTFAKLFNDDPTTVYFNIFRDKNNDIFAFLVLKSKYVINFKSDKFSLLDVVNEYVKEYVYNILEFEKTKMNADYDFLTKIYNRHGFFKRLENRKKFQTCALSIIDLDDFKDINDTFSHIAGDRVLLDFSNELLKWFGEENISRFGGEEFIVLIKDNLDNSYNKLNEFRKHISNTPVKFSGNDIYYTFSGGMTEFKDKEEFDDALKRADNMLYKAKNRTKNEILKDWR